MRLSEPSRPKTRTCMSFLPVTSRGTITMSLRRANATAAVLLREGLLELLAPEALFLVCHRP